MRFVGARAAGVALALLLQASAFAAETLPGIYALPDGEPKVSAAMTATPGPGGRQILDIAMTALGQPYPIRRYEPELAKRLHVIAISSDFSRFVHEHAERPGLDGHFRLAMKLPPGSYHVYADGVPAGLGQQVMRFELKVAGAAALATPVTPQPSGLEAADGRYGARFDPFALHEGEESELNLHITRDGQPAPDLTPFLGVAAHAVFIDAADLSYVHVHAAPAHGQAGTHVQHDMAAMAGMGAPLWAASHVPSDLILHILAPKAGTYLLWIQFRADGQVRTAPFVVAVE